MTNKLKRLHAELLETKLYYKEFNLLFLSQVFISESSYGLYKKFSLVRIVKEFSLDNVLKYILFKISNPFLKRRPGRRSDYLFINDVNNKPVVETLFTIKNEFQEENVGVIYFDRRLGVPQENVINAFEFVSIGSLLSSFMDILKMIPVLYKGRAEINRVSKHHHISSFKLLLNCLDSIFSINVVQTLFKHVSATKIILMTDVHKLSRIVTLCAQKINNQTFIYLFFTDF